MCGKLFCLIATGFLLYSCSGEYSFQTGTLTWSVSNKGNVVKIADRITGKDYLFKDKPVPLLSIRVQGNIESPRKLIHTSDSTLNLIFGNPSVNVALKFKCKDEYLTFEVSDVQPNTAVDLIIWGPYPTIIGKTIGETAGVVRNDSFAIGIQALNIKTLGGYPTNEDDEEPSYDIFATSDLADISDSVKIVYRGQTARPAVFGSVLQAYCRDRGKSRIIPVWGHEKYEVPAFDDGGVKGSKIALFGCSPERALETIGNIETGEGLPHPMLDGVWGKISPVATSSYLIMNFGVKNIDEAIVLTKKAGLNYLYHEGPFEDWGHFKLNEKEFPDNWQSLKLCVQKAEFADLHMGVHTLSNFITTNDPYVTPVPDPRLAKVGSSVLSEDINQDIKDIPIEDLSFFNQMKNNTLHAAVVGEEIIQYDTVSAERPWKLTGCVRGAFGTEISVHHKGDTISKLMDHPYKTFLGNMQLSVEMAQRIAKLFNETGLRQLSFDGLEGNRASGMGQYGRQLFVKTWYDLLKPELKGTIINDASNPGHYFWHIYTRMNWGEPWYAGFRESQTQYRLLNQDYFRRNFMPGMMGWFSMRPQTSLEDIEWMLARAAGFDAGFALITSPEIIKQNGLGETILETIKRWETARHRRVFSQEQRAGLRDIKNEYSLEPATGNKLILYKYHVQQYKEGPGTIRPVQTDRSVLNFSNPYQAQPLNFIIYAGDSTNLNNLSLSIDHQNKIKLTGRFNKGQVLKYTGDGTITVYDSTWRIKVKIPSDPQNFMVSNGNHFVQIICEGALNNSSSFRIELRTRDEGEIIQSGTSK